MPRDKFIHCSVWCRKPKSALRWAPGGNSVASLKMQSMCNSAGKVLQCSRLLSGPLKFSLRYFKCTPRVMQRAILCLLYFRCNSLVRFRINSCSKPKSRNPTTNAACAQRHLPAAAHQPSPAPSFRRINTWNPETNYIGKNTYTCCCWATDYVITAEPQLYGLFRLDDNTQFLWWSGFYKFIIWVGRIVSTIKKTSQRWLEKTSLISLWTIMGSSVRLSQKLSLHSLGLQLNSFYWTNKYCHVVQILLFIGEAHLTCCLSSKSGSIEVIFFF